MRVHLCSSVASHFAAAFTRRRTPLFILLFLFMVMGAGQAARAGEMSLTLAWEGSAEPGIGYMLFCRAEGESFDYENPAKTIGGGATTCTIQIPDDQTCYFVVRAFDDSGNESADSNEVKFEPTDTDGDGLPDVIEMSYGTDPKVADTDGDGIDDGDEAKYWGAENAENLLNPDVDGDGFLDGDEIASGSDPLSSSSTPSEIVYEDAQDGQVDRWGIKGGQAVAAIRNVEDQSGSSKTADNRLIELTGKGLKTRFTLQRRYGLPWHNTGLFDLSWRMKCSEKFRIEIEVLTASGKKRLLTYEPVDGNKLGKGKKVRFGLGSGVADGNWYCFARDLQADLALAQPGEELAEVNSFQIRGSGMLDDIKLMKSIPPDHDTDGDGISDIEEIDTYHTNPCAMDSDGDGINDFSELSVCWGVDDWDNDIDSDGVVNLLDFDSDGDGIGDGQESEMGTSPGDPVSTPDAVVYEDGNENGISLRWKVYKGKAEYATIESVEDPEKGRVVKLSGKKMGNGFQLSNRYGSPWRNGAHHKVSFSMKFTEKYRIEFEVTTGAGIRLMTYEPKDVDKLGRGKKVRFGLGSDTLDGSWKEVKIDLQQDLELAQPGAGIQEVNYMRIRGNGMIDEVVLSNKDF